MKYYLYLRQNMLYPENLKIFDNNRPEFKPYGFTVEKWIPKIMSRPDRHNEVEINLLTGGSITYLINDRKVTISAKRLAVFWALVPHQIIHFEGDSPYYVCTIPFTHFMNWQLPAAFVDYVLKGEVVYASSTGHYDYDKYLMDIWLDDSLTKKAKFMEAAIMEMRARLYRFGLTSIPAERDKSIEGETEFTPIDLVESMIIYIARNYTRPIKIEDVGAAVGLHPDYANSIFKKSFGLTLNQYLIQQRILHAQRQLSVCLNNIAEIAIDSGFNSLSRFNAAFKEKCGCTPSEYRKIHSKISD
jgi:AraC-like DNA-binding protein